MTAPRTVAVKAAEPRFAALKHMPSGTPFEADGTARWPADQFTFRLRDEGAIEITEALHEPSEAPAAEPAPAARKASKE